MICCEPFNPVSILECPMPDYTHYLSPFSWRYASEEMRLVWSEVEKRRLWRKIWAALARVEAEFGLLNSEQVADLDLHAGEIDIQRSLEIEAEIHHDLMAELKTFAAQSSVGGGALHLGATSMDIEDNADALRIRTALGLVIDQVENLLRQFAEKINQYADLPLIAFTHLQPAEPSTLGYRLSVYAQDLSEDLRQLRQMRDELKGKGFKGAVGTASSYIELLGPDHFEAFETV